MATRTERSLGELYRDDPERGEALAFGRRRLLQGAGRAAMGAALGMAMPFARNLPAGMLPIALAQGKGPQFLDYPGKDKGLVVLGDKPLVAETPEHLLDEETTSIGRFYMRNNGQIPDEAVNPDAWTFTVEGEVNQKLELTLGDLKQKFTAQTHRMVLECGGNGRAFFSPTARGNQWTNGGIGCAEWTGAKLSDVLRAAGLKDSAKYTGSWGRDVHLSGDPDKRTISRGNPLAKSMDPHTMIVWAMNGQPLPNIHGGPVRLLVPGWAGSLSTKWLSHIQVSATPHTGQGMGGTSYRVPVTPIVPGSSNDGKSFRDLEQMPIRSIVTAPATGTRLATGTRSLALRGAAWGSAVGVARIDVSVDFGQTWQQATMTPPRNPVDWVRWAHAMPLPSDGYFEVWSRATDRNGVTQPLVAPNWNPQGYGSNPINRIAVLVGVKLVAAALGAALLAGSVLAGPVLAQAVASSDPADFPDAPGREEAVTFCGACHSFRLVAAQGMTRVQWDDSMKWMVQRHNMPQLDTEERDVILGYLERAFPPKATGGRSGWTNPFAPRQ